ncbi:MAG: hypothetical protein RBQ70_03975 [Acholeplasma sp.]|jgi:hypothetical protein|nr:hypothetical protein [Acholeplasma sp.]
MTKTIIIKSAILVILSLTILTISIAGWLSNSTNQNNLVTVGDVEVEVDVYFLYDSGSGPERYVGNVYHVAESFEQGSFTKTGVYKVNISSSDDPQFIENLRVDIKIKSKVDTYFRIAVYEQLTLTFISGGKTYEVATTQEGPMPFNYMDSGDSMNPYFFDNRDNDGYFYYTDTVKRSPDTTPYSITFVSDFGSTPFNLYDTSYSLQLGYIIEAVQAIEGPAINWGLPDRPWDDGVW